MGCASPFVQPGDRIVVVPTVAMPLVLRRAGDATWRLIGPAFVVGMMEGERRENDVVENITLARCSEGRLRIDSGDKLTLCSVRIVKDGVQHPMSGVRFLAVIS